MVKKIMFAFILLVAMIIFVFNSKELEKKTVCLWQNKSTEIGSLKIHKLAGK